MMSKINKKIYFAIIVILIMFGLMWVTTSNIINKKQDSIPIENNQKEIENDNKDESKNSSKEKNQKNLIPVEKPKITIKSTHIDEIVYFQTKKVYDSSIIKGKAIISQNGVNGQKRLYYKITYTDGKKTKQDLIKSEILKKPINKIIKIGTKTPNVVNGFVNRTIGKNILNMVNQERAKIGVKPLVWNDTLAENAVIRAKELSIKFSHTRPNGTDWNTINPGLMHGENIAGGMPDYKTTMNKWMNSSGHRANILNPDYKSMSCILYYKNGSKWRWHWVQLFSRK